MEKNRWFDLIKAFVLIESSHKSDFFFQNYLFLSHVRTVFWFTIYYNHHGHNKKWLQFSLFIFLSPLCSLYLTSILSLWQSSPIVFILFTTIYILNYPCSINLHLNLLTKIRRQESVGGTIIGGQTLTNWNTSLLGQVSGFHVIWDAKLFKQLCHVGWKLEPKSQ